MINFINKMFGASTLELSADDLSRGTIVDVRTADEFKRDHIKGSINIPLQELERSLPKYRQLNTPVITCCVSGNRSGMAAQQLNAAGVKAINGGSWKQLSQQID